MGLQQGEARNTERRMLYLISLIDYTIWRQLKTTLMTRSGNLAACFKKLLE